MVTIMGLFEIEYHTTCSIVVAGGWNGGEVTLWEV